MTKTMTKTITALFVILLAAALAALLWFSLPYRSLAAAYQERPRPVTGMMVQINGQEPAAISLPAKFDNLGPRSLVALTAQAEIHPGDSLLIKSIFAPLRLYVNGALMLETGQTGSYPAYMNDPPALLTIVPLAGYAGTVDLRAEYLSPTQRSTLSVPALAVGNEAALLAEQVRADGFTLLFSLILIFLGLALILLSLLFLLKDASGSSLLWLGLFSLSVGVWDLGECELSAFLLPYPVLLYSMDYMGLFLFTIPLLHFGLVILNHKSRWPLRIMLWVHYTAVAAALILQFAGKIDFIKSLYWFHIIMPLGFVAFAASLVWDHFRHHNPAAKRFAPAVIPMAAAMVMEVLNYWLRLTGLLTVIFQFGILIFVISLTIISGLYARQSLRTAVEKTRLEYEMAATARQLALQRQQYRKMEENNAAVRAQRHDIRHHLAVLRGLSQQDDLGKLSAYIDTLIRQVPVDQEIRLCENYAVNTVATHYDAAAKAASIRTELFFAIPGELGQMLESDLCIVVGNLLENAVEACERMTTGERFIRLNSCLEYGCLTLTVENRFAGQLKEKEGIFLSAKREGEGLGLSSVAAVAQKYGGAARFSAKDGVFCALVYMQLSDLF